MEEALVGKGHVSEPIETIGHAAWHDEPGLSYVAARATIPDWGLRKWPVEMGGWWRNLGDARATKTDFGLIDAHGWQSDLTDEIRS